MRSAFPGAAALVLAALAGAPVDAQHPDSAVVGSWSGQARITVSWTVQRTLAVRLDIREDQSVTGTIGDARLVDGRLYSESRVVRALGLARQYAIAGKLNGCLIRAEGVLRDRVHLSLERSGQTLTGDLQTSGAYEGRPSDLILTAGGIVLHRAERAVAARDFGGRLPRAQIASPSVRDRGTDRATEMIP